MSNLHIGYGSIWLSYLHGLNHPDAGLPQMVPTAVCVGSFGFMAGWTELSVVL